MTTQNEAYKEHLEVLETSEIQIKSLHHNIKNHFLTLRQLLESGDTKEAIIYCDSVYDFVEKRKGPVASGNARVDSFLNYKLSSAEDMGIAVAVHAMLPLSFPFLFLI